LPAVAKVNPYNCKGYELIVIFDANSYQLALASRNVEKLSIDATIANQARGRIQFAVKPNAFLEPGAIAEHYLSIINQRPSTWSSESAVRPWLEVF